MMPSRGGKPVSVRRITSDAMLTAIALTIFMVEAQITPVIAVPGIKLGLSNIVTLIAMYLLSGGDAAAILALRIFLGSVFGGNTAALIYSGAGGALSFLVMILMSKLLGEKQIWAVSIFSAVAHNIGQLIAAAFVLSSSAVFSYTPVLIITAVFVGVFTGLCAQYTVHRLKKLRLR